MREYALFLRLLAERVLTARLRSGAHVLDASDFREWLIELADKAEKAETIEEFFEGGFFFGSGLARLLPPHSKESTPNSYQVKFFGLNLLKTGH